MNDLHTGPGADLTPVILTDDQKKAQPLLEGHGIILTPDQIDADSYIALSWAIALGRIMHPRRALELRLSGLGGESRHAFALIDLIQADGNIDGVVLGEANSAHANLWAACARRYVFPHSCVELHRVTNGGWNGEADSRLFSRLSAEYDWADDKQAALWADVSNRSATWWRDQFGTTSRFLTVRFGARELIEDLCIARPYSERQQDLARAFATDRISSFGPGQWADTEHTE